MVYKSSKSNLILPNTFIVGVAKSGTTSIFDWLADHPEVCGSREKEAYYLCDKGNPLMNSKFNYYKNGLEGYSHFFQHYDSKKHKVILEGSPSYFYEDTPLKVIASFNPHAQIIIILRKPSARVYSSYQFARNTMSQIDHNMSFSKFIETCREYAGKPLMDHKTINTLGFNSIEGSRYANFMHKWLATFDRNNIHVYLTEEFSNPLKLMKCISKDIGINSSFWDTYKFERKMETYLIKNQFLHRVVLYLFRSYLKFNLPRSWINAFENTYLNINTQQLPPIGNCESKILKKLDVEFIPDNEELERMLDIKLLEWK